VSVVLLAFLLAVSALFAQGTPPVPNQGGVITGVLRTPAGAPAVGVRVAALTLPDALKDLALSSSFAGLGETDATGRYRLENIPPGRYYIVAGRVDAQTFYPGTVVPAEGTVVSVSAGGTFSALDFVLNAVSVGRANPNAPGVVVALQVSVDGGGKVPLFTAGKFPAMRFIDNTSPTPLPDVYVSFNEPNVTLSPAYQAVGIGNFPDSYRLKRMTANFGAYGQNVSFLLTHIPPPIVGGVRLTGRVSGNPKRSITISGAPGTIYTDGTFEFLGVPPGVHTIVTGDNPAMERPLGVAVVVGDRDIPNVELEPISALPVPPESAAVVVSTGNRAPGTRVGPVALRGRIVDAETGLPFNAGKAYVNGDYGAAFSLDDEGRFEMPKLLPGSYNLEVFVFGVGNVSRKIVIEDADVVLELSLSDKP
jgi:hypothetical protein